MVQRGMLSRAAIMMIVATATIALTGINPAAANTAAAPVAIDATTRNELVEQGRAFVQRRTDALVGTGAAQAGSPTLRLSASLAATQLAAVGELNERRTALAEVGERYSEGFSKVARTGVTTGTDTVTVELTELTTLYYAKVTGLEPPFTAFETSHVFVFGRDGAGTWVMQSHARPGEGPAPINEPTGARLDAMRAVLTRPPSEKVVKPATRTVQLGGSVTATYNYSAMASYAEAYWLNYNSAYRNWAGSGGGGDCTNFISQSMRAGGWSDDIGWYRDFGNWWYNSANETTTWINVGGWYSFAAQNSHRTYILGSVWSLATADVLQMDFTNNGSKDHSMIVTYMSDQPYLTYHTTNTFRRSLNSIISSNPSAVWYAHRT